MSEIGVDVLRVFTRKGYGGNPLGVVARTFDDNTMLGVARILGFSEVVFVSLGEHRTTLRIFTPTQELPFAGHPLVGAAYWLSSNSRGDEGEICTLESAHQYQVVGTKASTTSPGGQPVRRLDGFSRAWRVDVPMPYDLIEFPSPGEVAAFRPTARMVGQVFIFAFNGEGRVKARFFASSFGVAEDPATGSAAVALAAVMRFEGRPSGALTIDQGDEIESPSTIELAWVGQSTTLGGHVAIDKSTSVKV